MDSKEQIAEKKWSRLELGWQVIRVLPNFGIRLLQQISSAAISQISNRSKLQRIQKLYNRKSSQSPCHNQRERVPLFGPSCAHTNLISSKMATQPISWFLPLPSELRRKMYY